MRPLEPTGIGTTHRDCAVTTRSDNSREAQQATGRGQREEPRNEASGARRETGGRSAEPAGHAVDPLAFRAMLCMVEAPGSAAVVPEATGTTGRGIEAQGADLVTLASSGDGTHLAVLRVKGAAGDELGVTVVLDRGHICVRVEAPDAAASAWLEARAARIREAVEASGVDLERLDLGRRGDDGPDTGRERRGDGDAPPAPRRRIRRP